MGYCGAGMIGECIGASKKKREKKNNESGELLVDDRFARGAWVASGKWLRCCWSVECVGERVRFERGILYQEGLCVAHGVKEESVW